ncbi:unnamed protein product [Vicia faba]|uniref:Uncharacterized protein n=1 Tax=Vicia faba TaxID=3906 RepID=A0AAV1AG63_VICFA|nr:unnamed protein product [Vicia faba]
MKRIIRDRDQGIKYDVHWSQEGQLIEPNGSTLTSYLGSVVRREIPITCEDWRARVLDDAKDKIWSETQKLFIIEDTRRDYILKLAGKLHRGFRAFLSNKILRDADKFFVDAELPKKYADLITAKEWETFKFKINTQKFESLSVVNRQQASSPTYPYRKRRMGYARLQQSILTKENSSETSLSEHILWKEARVCKDGAVEEKV